MLTQASVWGAIKDKVANDIVDLVSSGAPTDGTSGTGVGISGPGSTYFNTATGIKYVNINTKASPTWDAVVTATSTTTLTNKTLTAPALGAATGTSLAVTGAVTSSGGGIGYATGAGGTALQATNKSTGVTVSKLSGQITMNNAALATDVIVSFILTNTFIAVTDLLILNHLSGGTLGSYVLNAQCMAGSATINVANRSAGSLSEAIVLAFAVVKGVIA